MAKGEYVDIDIYGRGFDGIFGPGAEDENRRQAMMKFQALMRFQQRVKPGEYIDLDLYGRADPRIFGPGAHIQTQKEAQRHLEEVQERKMSAKYSPRAMFFRPGIKAIAKKARDLIRRIHSSSVEGSESDIRDIPYDNVRGSPEYFENNAVHASITESPEAGKTIVDEHSSPVDDGRLDEEASDPAFKSDEQPNSVEETATGPQPVEDTTATPDFADRTPRRVKSRLPNEEARPLVEKGYVLRVIKSFSSFDRNDDQMNVTGSAAVAEPFDDPNYSSSPKGSEPDSDKEADAGPVQDDGLPGPVSKTEEESTRVLDDSDEELQLSFSRGPQNAAVLHSSDNASTSSDEGLTDRNSQPNDILLDEAGRSVSGGKFAKLFRSNDSEPDSEDTHGTSGSRAPGGSNESPESCSSTEDEQFSENIVPVPAISTDDVHLEEADLVAAETEESGSIIDSRGNSIVHVVEIPDLSPSELDEEVLLKELFEEVHEEEEAVMEPSNIMEATEDLVASETDERIDEQVVDNETPSSKTNSGTTDNEAAETEYSSKSVEDSDRSSEANSSSEVMSSSLEEEEEEEEEEDSDDVEVAEVDSSEPEEDLDQEEDAIEIQDVEGAESNEVPVSNSSDAMINSETDVIDAGASSDTEEKENSGTHDVDGAAEDDGNNKTIWQRLGLFNAVMSNSWIVF